MDARLLVHWKDKRASISPRVSHEIKIGSSRSNPIPQHLLSLRRRLFLEIGKRAFVGCPIDLWVQLVWVKRKIPHLKPLCLGWKRPGRKHVVIPTDQEHMIVLF